MSFPLFTSIKPTADPAELSYLRGCLSSWRAAGFTPVAVNGPGEIETLSGFGLPVEFAALPADGRPRIGALLDAVRASGAAVAGIINSDCSIIGFPGLASRLQAGLVGRLALAWRTDVDGGAHTAMRHGFDGFFFDAAVLPGDDAGFSIGDTWWDLWFPLACEANGAAVEVVGLPLLLHRAHPLNWNFAQWLRNGRCLWSHLQQPGSPSTAGLYQMAADIPARLRARPRAVCITGSAAMDAALGAAGEAMLDAAEVARLRRATAVFRTPGFRRLTAPLRAAVRIAHG
jgi:hypothetical protein